MDPPSEFLDTPAERHRRRRWPGDLKAQIVSEMFTWPAIRDGLMSLNHAQFEALFAGLDCLDCLDWRRVKALAARPPAAAERLGPVFERASEC